MNCTPISTANCRPTVRRPSPPGLPTHPEQAALVASWRAQAESIRARYGADCRRTGSGTAQARPDAQQGRVPTDVPGLRWLRLRPLWLLSSVARPAGWRAAPPPPPRPSFDVYRQRSARRLQALRGRSAPSGRSAGQRACAHDAMAVEAAGRGSAHSRSAVDRTETGRWPAASRSDRSGGFLHV